MEGNHRKSFWGGVLTGVTLTAALLGGAVAAVRERGVTVTVDTGELEAAVRQEMETALRRELPEAVEQLQDEVPRRVAAEARRRMASHRVELGGIAVTVPETVIQEVERQVEEAVRSGLDLTVADVELEDVVQRVGEEGSRLVSRELNEALDGRTLSVRLAPWFSIPVTIDTD